MAIIKIIKIKETPQVTINYCISDKEELVITKNSDDVIDYTIKDKMYEMTKFKTIATPINCTIKNAAKEMEAVRNMFGKNNNILMFHVVQNFGIEVDPNIANEIGCKFAERFLSEFQCIVSTHTNTDHTHNHIVFNNCSLIDGKKYYDNNKNYAQMRKISDELCREYGLPVLEDTKDYKLTKYIDINGKTKFYEPTPRKDKINMYSNANDYRNQKSFETLNEFKNSNRTVIKKDIDSLINSQSIKCYEDLLSELIKMGYEIKSKKVNGDWLAHVSFKAPSQSKFSRDYKIGEFYTRENLNNYFKNSEMGHPKVVKKDPLEMISGQDIPSNNEIFVNTIMHNTEINHLEEVETFDNLDSVKDDNVSLEEDIYTFENIDKLNESFRNRVSYKSVVKRTDFEKDIVINTKSLNREFKQNYFEYIDLSPSKVSPKAKRKDYLLNCINSNLNTLKFIDSNEIDSFEQIIKSTERLKNQADIINKNLKLVKVSLDKLSSSFLVIEKYNKLKLKLSSENTSYDMLEYDNDLLFLRSLESKLIDLNLLNNADQIAFLNKFKHLNDSYNNLNNSLKVTTNQIDEYIKCVATIDRVDKSFNNRYSKDIKLFNKINSNKENQINITREGE